NLFNESNPIGSVNFPNGSYLGCDSVVHVELSYYPTSIGQFSQTLCTGGSFSIGGTVFDAANPSGTVTLANAGANGCDSIVQVSLSFNSVVTSTLAQTLCPGESLSIGGNLFNESNPIGSVNFPNGSYLGCDSVVHVALSYYPTSIGQFSQTLCTGGSLSIGGTVFDTANPSGTVTLANAGANGCDSVVHISLSFNSVVTSSLAQTLCLGESINVNGTIFNENNPAGSVYFLNGSYLGCDSIAEVALSFYPPANGSLEYLLCYGESVSVNGMLFDENNPTGTISLPGRSFNGCDSVLNVSLSFLQESFFSIDSMMQPGEVLEVNGTVYSEQLPTGVEMLVGGNWLGCDSTISINLSYPLVTISSLLSVTMPTCPDDSDGVITIVSISGGQPPYSASLNGGPMLEITALPFQFDGLVAGSYELVIANSLGLGETELVVVPAPANLLLDLGLDLSIGLGESVSLNPTMNFVPTAYLWEPPDFLDCTDCEAPVATPITDISYRLTATDEHGCQASDEVSILVKKDSEVYAPNGFSPNGDGINDAFTLYSGPQVVKIYSLLIFDRWGNAVFENYHFLPNLPEHGWDGISRGQEMDSAVFVWFAEVEMVDGSKRLLKGGLTLVR
ncbi:MAG: gliding motility-associated C-terminal domain-containing protein, partial [Saprospiraceae bacterium]|nr:gliding motility-associated C-terminal domain-containing protein [Saprospiraceae bacterium]